MRFLAILNRGGGTLRTIDLDAFSRSMADVLEAEGHTLEVRIVDGEDIVGALARAARADDVDVVLAGGGDGTISAAAAELAHGDKALAVLPAGTMNLFARSLNIPLPLDEAIAAFAHGSVREVDVASVNGRIFVHQYSVGVHAKLVRLRDEMSFASRLGKIWASLRAGVVAILDPPSMTVDIALDGAEVNARTSGVAVTNNLFGEGHLPYADDPAGATLGIYIAGTRGRLDMVRLFAGILAGYWDRNPQVEIHEANRVVLRYPRIRARHRCVIDGELERLQPRNVLEIHPRALKVLVPGGPSA